MATNLSLIEIADNSLLATTPLVEGRITRVLAFDESYIDHSGVRTRIPDVIYLVNEAARSVVYSPVSDKFYFVKSNNTLYVYYATQWHPVTTVEDFAPFLAEYTTGLIPVTITKGGIKCAPRTLTTAVFTEEGVKLSEIIENLILVKNAATLNNKTANATPNTVEQDDLIAMINEIGLVKARDARSEGVKQPSWYITNLYINMETFEINTASNVGLSGSDICHVVTSLPTTDISGVVSQKIYNTNTGVLYTRKSTNSTTWSTVSEVLSTSPAANTDGRFDKSATAPTGTTRLNYSGYLYATRVYGAVWNDYAEYFEKGEEVDFGDIVRLDPETGNYVKSTIEYDKLVVGVCSDSYGHLLGGKGDEHDEENFIPVGMAGRVGVKVIGKVEPGDFIVSSPIPGVGMKGELNIPGTVVGKVLETKTTDEIKRVKVLIMNQ
jgi:hypothetical protein